jgi:hypothetical protein
MLDSKFYPNTVQPPIFLGREIACNYYEVNRVLINNSFPNTGHKIPKASKYQLGFLL